MAVPAPSHTRRLAEFAAGLRLEHVPAHVVARAKAVILDGLGCGLFSAHVQWTEILARVIGRLEPAGGQASVWGRGETACTVDHYLGSHHRPLGDEQVFAKFRQLAHRTVSPEAVAAIEHGVLQLEQAPCVAGLVQALQGRTTHDIQRRQP